MYNFYQILSKNTPSKLQSNWAGRFINDVLSALDILKSNINNTNSITQETKQTIESMLSNIQKVFGNIQKTENISKQIKKKAQQILGLAGELKQEIQKFHI